MTIPGAKEASRAVALVGGGVAVYFIAGTLVAAWAVKRAADGKPYWSGFGPEPVQLASLVLLWPLAIPLNLVAK